MVQKYAKKYLINKRGQAIVEFAIALPFLLLILYGVFELARLAFIFSSVSNASRAAARYGAGMGENSNGIPHFEDCEGIRKIAEQSAYIIDFTEINITYDRGVNSDGTQIPISGIDPEPSSNNCPIENTNLRNGDRIIVQISADYEPIVSIVPIESLNIVSATARTFIVSIPIFGSSVPLAFSAETSTPSVQPIFFTKTLTNTPVFTSTRIPIDLTQFAYDLTNAPTVTLTSTPSNTPLPSLTPSITPTRIACSGIASINNGPLQFRNELVFMEIFNNTGYPIAVSQFYLEWNHDKGHLGENQSLHLQSISLNNQSWKGDILAPSQYIIDFRPLIPPGSSVVQIGFNQSYDTFDGTERLVISLLTPGCEGYLIDSRK